MKTYFGHKDFILVLLHLAVSLLTWTYGCSQFWTSPVLPKLNGLKSGSLFQDPITVTEVSQITSFFMLGCIFGPLLAAIFNDRIGRKYTLLMSCIIISIAYMCTIFAASVMYLLYSRFFIGLGTGCIIVVMNIYASEIARKSNRGTVNSFTGVTFNIGALICLGIGPYVNVQVLSILCSIPSILGIVAFMLVPESPYYLVQNSREEEALNSLKILRNCSNEIHEDLLEIKQFVYKKKKHFNKWRNYFRKDFLRCFSIAIGLNVVMEFSGFIAIASYMQTIFIASGSRISSEISSIIIGIIQLMSISISTKLVDILGKRPLFLISVGGCCLSLLMVGIYFYLLDYSYDVDNIYWLPLLCVIMFMISFKLALAVLPRAIMSEIFPADMKSIASTIAVMFQQTLAFLIAMYFPIISETMSMAYVFWFFSVCSAFSFIYIFFMLPETKGKSFEEIQELINSPKLK